MRNHASSAKTAAVRPGVPPVHDRWVYGGLLALLVWAPLPLGSNRTWAIGILVLLVVALLGGMVWAWRHHSTQALSQLQPFAWPLGLLFAMLLWSWAQTLPLPAAWVQLLSPLAAAAEAPASSMTLSLDVYQSHITASLCFVYFSAFLLATMTLRDSDRLNRAAATLVFSGLLQSIVGVLLFSMKLHYTLFFVDIAHDRMLGTYVYHNSLAGYLCMCLSMGIGLMLARLDGKSRHYANWQARTKAAIAFVLSPTMRLRLYLVVMVIALVLTRSRMGNSAFFTALLVAGLLAVLLARKTAPQTIALVLSLIVIDVLVVGTGVGLEKVVQRIEDTELRVADGGLSESVEARTEAARLALPLVKDYWLTGSGGGSFYNLFMTYRSPTYGNAYVSHAHNDFVEIASDYGLPGLALLGLVAVSSLVRMVWLMARRRSRLPWGMAFGVAMAIVALTMHSTVDFNLQIPANALTMVVILAMGWVAGNLPSERFQKTRRSPGTELA